MAKPSPQLLSGLTKQLNVPAGMAFLNQFEDWPHQLRENFMKSAGEVPVRFVILDDSGSMNSNDGHRMVSENHDPYKTQLINCSRWEELRDFVRFHASFAEAAEAVTEFRFLHAEPIVIGGSKEDDGNSLKTLLDIANGSTTGSTPLCRHVREIIKEIESKG
jgi:hypothetical protein